MFCTSCGAQMPDNAAFCTSCGNKLNCDPVQTVQEQPTVQQSAPPQPIIDQNSKNKPLHKKLGIGILITFFLSLLLIVAGIAVPLTSDVEDIPIIDVAFKDVIDDTIEEIAVEHKKLYKENKDDMTYEELKTFKRLISDIEDLESLPPLLELRDKIDDINDDVEDIDKLENYSMDFDEYDEVSSAIEYVIIGIAAIYILPLIFLILGSLLKNVGLTITALAFMVVFQTLLCGFLWVALSLIVYIIQAILCVKYKKAKLQANT